MAIERELEMGERGSVVGQVGSETESGEGVERVSLFDGAR
jgi:hypothetical protein